jgi:hypothetical protein
VFLNIFHVRAALAIAGLMVLIAFLASGGSFGRKNTIQIEFGMYPREFQGLQVEIDGEMVGTLERLGQATRTPFSVKDGEHTVRVLHPEYACEKGVISTGVGGSDVMLVLDFVGERDGKPLIGFQ